MEPQKQVAVAIQIHSLFDGGRVDLDFGDMPVYAFALACLAYRWMVGRVAGHRDGLHGIRVMAWILRFLSAMFLLVVALIIAVARCAGRSTFHAGRHF